MAKNRLFTQFLGTGAGDFKGIYKRGSDGKYGTEARDPDPRNIRQASALYIAPDILIDFYNLSQLEVHSVPKELIRHLLITHTHWDHFQPVLIHDFALSLPHPLTVYGSTTAKHALDFTALYRWDHINKKLVSNRNGVNIEVKVVSPGDSFTIGTTKIAVVLANHFIGRSFEHGIENYLNLEQQALNFIIERNGKTLLYAVDSSYVIPMSFEIFSRFQFDIVIIDATFGNLKIDPAGTGHLNFEMLDETIEQFRKANLLKENTIIIGQHLSEEVKPLSKSDVLLAPKGIVLAYDGMVIDF